MPLEACAACIHHAASEIARPQLDGGGEGVRWSRLWPEQALAVADHTECAIGQLALDDVTVPCLDTCDMLNHAVVAHDCNRLCWVIRQRLHEQLKAVIRRAVQLGGWSPSLMLGIPKLVCPLELVYAAYLARQACGERNEVCVWTPTALPHVPPAFPSIATDVNWHMVLTYSY